MKKYLSILIGIFMVGSATSVYATESCLKCHKTKEALAEKIKKAGANSEAELVDFLKNKSSKKAIHASLKEEEIKQAFSKINSSKTTSEKTSQEASKTKKKAKAAKTSKSNSNATKKSESNATSPVKEEKKEAPKPKKKVEGC